jgi:hypothetical protein
MGNIDISQEAASSKAKLEQENQATPGSLLVSDLDWSAEEVRETRARLATLEEDWDAPGMEAYDAL